jgi:hypothetical protein
MSCIELHTAPYIHWRRKKKQSNTWEENTMKGHGSVEAKSKFLTLKFFLIENQYEWLIGIKLGLRQKKA